MAVLKIYCSRAQYTRRLLELFGIKLLRFSMECSGLLDSILYFFFFFFQGCRTLFVGCFKGCRTTVFYEFPKVVRWGKVIECFQSCRVGTMFASVLKSLGPVSCFSRFSKFLAGDRDLEGSQGCKAGR